MKEIWLTVFISSSLLVKTLSQGQKGNWERGFGDQYKSENTLGQYAFGYNEDHTSGGSFRRESGDQMGNKVGSYGLRISDGRVRIVNYVADRNGFRADVVSNEPGVESQKSNKYMNLSKKSVIGVLIPGFRYSDDPLRVTFQQQQPLRIKLSDKSKEIENKSTQQRKPSFGDRLHTITKDANVVNHAYATHIQQEERSSDPNTLDKHDLSSTPSNFHDAQTTKSTFQIADDSQFPHQITVVGDESQAYHTFAYDDESYDREIGNGSETQTKSDVTDSHGITEVAKNITKNMN